MTAARQIRIAILDDQEPAVDRYSRLFAERTDVAIKLFRTRILTEASAKHLFDFDPDLIIADLVMDDSDYAGGVELIKKLCGMRQLRTTPIVVCSLVINATESGLQRAEHIRTAAKSIRPLGVAGVYSKSATGRTSAEREIRFPTLPQFLAMARKTN